jgi:hypothetical protein
MGNPLQTTVAGVLKNFSKKEGEKKLQIASLWESVSKGVTLETQIIKIENKIVFIKVANSILAQELKLRTQRTFIKKYEEKFGEKLKDMRFIVGE